MGRDKPSQKKADDKRQLGETGGKAADKAEKKAHQKAVKPKGNKPTRR